MTWMLTGGAGYIGSHLVRAFQAAGHDVVVLDDLSTGIRSFVKPDVPLVHADVVNCEAVTRALQRYKVTGIVHLGGYKYAGVSVREPLECYRSNVEGTRSLLAAAVAAGVTDVLFSSSAAVYGTPDVEIVTEDTTKAPLSPYGESKLIGEWLFADVARAHDLRWSALRYFNVVGSGFDDLYDASPHNLFPLVIDALSHGRRPKVLGTDYATPDGSCVRDYVHVMDVAEAHVHVAQAISSGADVSTAYNVGVGTGTSVIEIMDAFGRVLGSPVDYETGPRRPGDPARIVASSARLAKELGWRARFDLDDMVSSAWASRPTV